MQNLCRRIQNLDYQNIDIQDWLLNLMDFTFTYIFHSYIVIGHALFPGPHLLRALYTD